MKRFLTSVVILAVVAVLSAWAYHQVEAGVESDEGRYDLFDLLQQRPLIGQILGQAGVDKPKETLRAKPIDLNSTSLLDQVNRSLADLSDAVVPSVVSIDTTTNVDVTRFVPTDPFGFSGYRKNERLQTPGLGSGVIVSEDGYVVTNHHVVAGVDAISITVHGGLKYLADWVGSDPQADIAVLRIRPVEGGELPKFQALAFADSDKVRVGEMVLAVGNPFGLNETVTRGIVSAKQRQLSDGTNEYFQVDAVINPGNSGGPLVNVHGEIIGINVAIFTGQQDVKVWQGIGLTIPANEAKAVFEAIAYGKPLIRGYIGVSLHDLNVNLARALGMNSTNGALVTQVATGSPAETAGLIAGDVIAKFDGKSNKNAQDTYARIRTKNTNEAANLTIVRKGKLLKLPVTVMSKSDTNTLKLKSDITASGQSIADALGITIRDLTLKERSSLGLSETDPVILISKVKPGSQAEKRFRPGDFVHRINRDNVHTAAEFYDLLGSLPQDKRSIMILSRDGNRVTAVLNP